MKKLIIFLFTFVALLEARSYEEELWNQASQLMEDQTKLDEEGYLPQDVEEYLTTKAARANSCDEVFVLFYPDDSISMAEFKQLAYSLGFMIKHFELRRYIEHSVRSTVVITLLEKR